MRDIKIRAWNGAIFRYYPIGMTIYRMDRFELSISIGAKDKNDVDIYEGDILTNGDSKIKYIVEFLDNGFKARQVGNKSTLGIAYHKRWIEVVGNIYQNPDMIKDSE